MVETWRAIDWDQIDLAYTYGTHANDSGQVKDQLKAALFNEYEKVFQMSHDRVQDKGRGNAQIASSATPDIGASLFDLIHITGSVGITGFVAANPGVERELIFDAAPLLTHHATLLNLPGGVNIQAAAGDRAVFRCEGNGAYPGASGNLWTCTKYTRADGMPVGRRGAASGGASGGILDVNSDNALATAGDLLYRGANNGSPRWGIEHQGFEYVSNAGGGGVGTLERVQRVFSRPEAAPNDFTGVDFTMDGAWHDASSPGDERLDCSSIIPSGARSVGFIFLFRTSVAYQFCLITGEENADTVTTYNRMIIYNQAVSQYNSGYFRVTLPDDDSRKLSYLIAANTNYLNMTIIDWGF